MQQIKFRAYNKTENKWCSRDEFFNDIAVSSTVRTHSTVTIGGENSEGVVWEILQHTGLKDKYGKEIYEGDILVVAIGKPHILKNVIVFERGSFRHKWLSEHTSNIRGEKVSQNLFGNIDVIFEVVGNIYDNPEMLEETK